MTTTEADVAVIVVVSELEAAVADVIIVGVLKRDSRATSLIVVERAEEQEGGAMNELRSWTDVEVSSSSVVTEIVSEEEVTFVPPVELEDACEAGIGREASDAHKACAHSRSDS